MFLCDEGEVSHVSREIADVFSDPAGIACGKSVLNADSADEAQRLLRSHGGIC